MTAPKAEWKGMGVMFDLVIRNGTIVDGSGAPRYRADVGIVGDRISWIGHNAAEGREEVDATGLFVAPGFIDAHTHLDAQVCWDPLGPAAAHGVTSAIMGNCAISAAPCRDAAEREIFIVPAFEVAEDIHRPTITAGVSWEWSTFADYLAFLERTPKAINYGAQVGHGALRAYAMGERVFEKYGATDADIAIMCEELQSALDAGALGFTSMLEGAGIFSIYPPGTDVRDMDPRAICAQAAPDEIRALGKVLARHGRSSLQLAGSHWDTAVELSASTGLPLQFAFGTSRPRPEYSLSSFDEASERGANMIAAIPCRPQTSIVGFKAKLPFDELPLWRELRAQPLAAQRAALVDPATRATLLDVARKGPYPPIQGLAARAPDWDIMSIIDKELPPWRTVGERARAESRDPYELFIDLSLESEFDQFFSQPVTFNHDRATWLEILRHPRSVISLNDTGAHTAQAIEWFTPTFFLGYWVRQEQEFTWEEGVRMLTFDPASIWGGLGGRGLVREGMVADLALFDPQTVSPGMPGADNGLPGGGLRLTCEALGMHMTVVSGRIVMRGGVHTGALPGKLLTSAIH